MSKVSRIVLLIAMLNMVGCAVTSTPISTLGLHEQRIDIASLLRYSETPKNWMINDFPFKTDLINHGSVGLPYASIKVNAKKEKVIEFEVTDEFMASINNKEQKVIYVVVEGEALDFERDEIDGSHQLVRRYRTGKGFALQSLQVIAIPVDIVLTVVGGAIAVIVVPIAYLVGALGS